MSNFTLGCVSGTRTLTHSFSTGGQIDTYAFSLSTPGSFKASLGELDASADLRLLSAAGKTFDSASASNTRSESVSASNLNAGNYKLKVKRASGSANYSLNLVSDYADTTNYNLKLTSLKPTSSSKSGELYPTDSRVVNVKTAYGAKGDGVTDDTAAIQRAISDNIGFNTKPKIIYLPSGTYVVSKTLQWKDSEGHWDSYLSFQGQDQDSTVIRLKDKAVGFNNPSKPKAVIYTAAINDNKGNRAHNNFFENLTVDTGKGNAGAIGIDYLANNRSSIRDVTIQSGDRQGVTGLSMIRGWTGPALIEDVRIVGFNYGIKTVGPEYSITFKDLSLENQNVAGIDNTWNVLSIDGLTSRNTVPVIRNQGSNPNDNRSLVTLINGNFVGGKASSVAIENNAGEVYLRNIKSSGYLAALKSGTIVIPGAALAEYVSTACSSLFPSRQTSLNLPIKDAPTFYDSNFNNWANVVDYGAIPNDSKDDTAAVQAALNSGDATIYLPTGTYTISGTLHVPGTVKKIAGMESTLRSAGSTFNNAKKTTPLLRFETNKTDAVILERILIGGSGAGLVSVEQATARTVVIQDASLGGAISYRSASGAGQLFLEDVVGATWRFNYPQSIWARQLNAEGWESYPGNKNTVKIVNNGANLWILGLKTEVPNSVIKTTEGGKTELLGGLLYPTRAVSSNIPAFINDESNVSLVYAVSAYDTDRNYKIQVKETRNGTTKSLLKDDVLNRSLYGSIMPLYTGYK